MIKKAIIDNLNTNEKEIYYLPSITYEEFGMSNLFKEGSLDICWDSYLRDNNLTDFEEVKERKETIQSEYPKYSTQYFNILLIILIEDEYVSNNS